MHSLSESQRDLRAEARRFAHEHVEPVADELDRTATYPEGGLAALGERRWTRRCSRSRSGRSMPDATPKPGAPLSPHMQWKLFANLAETTGRKEVEVGEGATFRDAFDALLERHPELREEVVDEDGGIREHIRVLRNESNPFVADEGFDTELEAGDTLALFPPVSGG